MTKKHLFVLPLLLLAASVLTVYPAMTLEKPQLQASSGTVTINASGQAFPVSGKSKNTGVSATLTLSGSTRSEGDGGLKLGGLSGSLVIDTATYTITGGSGEISKKGKTEIDANTALAGVPTMPDGARKLELVLHGSMQGTNVAFTSRESKLSSLYFLSLTGLVVFTQGTMTTTNTGRHNGDDNNPTTVTVTQHDTTTQTVTETQQSAVTTTESVDHTVTETVTETVTLTSTSSVVTVTETTTTTVTTT